MFTDNCRQFFSLPILRERQVEARHWLKLNIL